MKRLDDALAGVHRLGIDSAPIIYFVEANPTYDARVTAIFDRIDRGLLTGITSTITLTEGLVLPLSLGDKALADRYRSLLLSSRNVHVVATYPAIAETAAQLRARYRLRTPDALQIATALNAGCTAFLTNDKRLAKVSELSVLVLDNLKL